MSKGGSINLFSSPVKSQFACGKQEKPRRSMQIDLSLCCQQSRLQKIYNASDRSRHKYIHVITPLPHFPVLRGINTSM
jgi:hypothetical protein